MNRHFGYYAFCAAAMLLLPAAVSAGHPANVPEQAPAGQYAESYRVLDSHTGEIREVPVRDYLIGAVGAEMPASFAPEALKAQTVACHTYAERIRSMHEAAPDPALGGADFSDDPNVYQAFFTEDALRRFYGSSFAESYASIAEAVDAVSDQILCYADEPIVAAFHAISSGGYYAAVITVSQLISRLSATVFTPLLTVFLSLSVSASISSRVRLGGFIELASKGFKYGIALMMSIFTAVIGLNGALSGAADSVANKAARFGLSSFIPLIGSSIAEAYSALQNSVSVLRSGAGVFVIIALFVSFAPLITQSVLWSTTLWIAKSIGEMLSVTSASPIINALSQFISALRALLIAVMTVFIISTSIMMSLGGRT